MKKTSNNLRIRAIAIAMLFLLSATGAGVLLSPASASPSAPASASPSPLAAPLSQAEANWASPDGNTFNQNYNPQNQINASNANYLGLAWLFPVPPKPAPLVGYTGFVGEGVDSAPLIVNGSVYVFSQNGQIFALNAANGDVEWSKIIPLTLNSTSGIKGVGSIELHEHDGSEQFTTKLLGGTPTLWYAAPDLRIYAINALTGAYELNFSYYGGVDTIAGNSPTAVEADISHMLAVDQNRGVVITSIGSGSSAATGRCMFRGWNVNVSPPTLMWTTFCTPPQPGSSLGVDPNWDMKQVNNMSGAEIFYPGPSANGGGYIPNNNGQAVVNLKTLSASVLNSTLYNDWGYMNQSGACLAYDGGGSTGSTAQGWGAPWLIGAGQTAGMAFVNTNNRDPYNGPCVPGPSLWSASILALNETNGNWIWGFQTATHEEWDWDCSWWQGLGNETISGVQTEVLWKTCKDGYLYELNAKTGNLIWAWTPLQSIEPRCFYCYMHNPLNATQMAEDYFAPGREGASQATIMNPSLGAGIESEVAYNPTTNYLYLVTQNNPILTYYVPINSTNYLTNPGMANVPLPGVGPTGNATVSAVNAATGQSAWTYFIPNQGFRGAVSTSGGLVFVSLKSGDILMLDAVKGTLANDVYIGGPLDQLPTIGATIAGTEEIVMSIDQGFTFGVAPPGDIFALTLKNLPPTQSTSTVTSTSVSTSTITSTSTSVSTSTAPGTVTTTTITGPGGVTTTTVTQSGAVATTTVTSTSVSTSSGSSTALYGVAAVAVIFIIVSGYLAMTRGRRPSS